MQCIIRDLKEMIYVVLKHHCHFKCVKSNELKKDKKMAIRPNPYKLICPKCGYSKVVSLKSDCLNPKDLISMSPVCPKCKEQMDRKDTNMLDDIFSMFKR